MLVLPRPRVREFLQQPGTTHLVVTDCGYFPEAQSHGRNRHTALTQAIVMVCVKGKGWCETAAGRFEVEAGQVVILPPGHPHSYGADGDDPWTLWWLHVAGRELPEFLDAAGMTIDAPVRKPSNLYHIVTLMTEVVQWMERDSTTPSLLAAAGAAWHVLALLAADRTTSDGSTDVIDQAAAYLRAHINEHISVTELAAMARLSSSHFSALFKKHIGYPVLQYQTQLRMARAREMLDTTSASISSISDAVGYPDAFYFARQFKQVHGTTPRDYRAQHKG
jgi:AraC family transcriptional regulator of arabinose operon